MAKELQQGSFNPDEFASGRPDNFVGTITDAVAAAWRWPKGKSGKYQLFVRVSIEPEEGSPFEPFVEPLQAGWLNSCVPSQDGTTPAGEITYEEYEALGNGEAIIEEGEEEKYQGYYVLGKYSRNSDFDQFCNSLRECGFKDWSTSLETLKGLRCRFDRIPQTREGKKSGDTGEQKGEWKVLVPTEMLGKEKKAESRSAKAGATGAKGKSKAADAEAAESNGDFHERFDQVVMGLLADAPDNTLTKGKLAPPMLKAFTDKTERATAVKLCGDVKYLSGADRPWTYDGDTGSLSLG